jgi:16S rRNA (guanine527-N7)-methyltransferase
MSSFGEAAQILTGIHLTSYQLDQFQKYEDILVEWNQRINLTAIREVEAIRTRHFLDSLTCWLSMQGSPIRKVIDVGTGAGFPGIPLKIAFPEIQLTLVESVGKKARFCQLVVDELHLDKVNILSVRAEEIGHQPEHREMYDWALARALAGMPSLVEYLLPLVRVGGFILAQKGFSATDETRTAQQAIHVLGGKVDGIGEVHLPGVPDIHYLVKIQKVSPTPDLYPRASGLPLKKPIQ